MCDTAIKPYTLEDIPSMQAIWNDVVRDGIAFPGDVPLNVQEMQKMLQTQTAAFCAFCGRSLVGLYVLHPNNIGRCAHIANASYAVAKGFRGKGIGRMLVVHSLKEAARQGFLGMQFNAVVAGNTGALALYKQLGFVTVGTIPGGFRLKEGPFSNMHIMFKTLAK